MAEEGGEDEEELHPGQTLPAAQSLPQTERHPLLHFPQINQELSRRVLEVLQPSREGRREIAKKGPPKPSSLDF